MDRPYRPRWSRTPPGHRGDDIVVVTDETPLGRCSARRRGFCGSSSTSARSSVKWTGASRSSQRRWANSPQSRALARYSQPSWLGMKVMSLHQARLGWSGSNSPSRPGRSGAGWVLASGLVRLRRRLGRKLTRPWAALSRSARLWFTSQPRRHSSAVYAWCPVDPSKSAWMTRISATRSACSRLVSVEPFARLVAQT
jgi:hypothetical protein